MSNADYETMKKYGDILYVEYPYESRHRKMPNSSRAAQFAPFAALSGYEESLNARLFENISRISEEEAGIPFVDAP